MKTNDHRPPEAWGSLATTGLSALSLGQSLHRLASHRAPEAHHPRLQQRVAVDDGARRRLGGVSVFEAQAHLFTQQLDGLAQKCSLVFASQGVSRNRSGSPILRFQPSSVASEDEPGMRVHGVQVVWI